MSAASILPAVIKMSADCGCDAESDIPLVTGTFVVCHPDADVKVEVLDDKITNYADVADYWIRRCDDDGYVHVSASIVRSSLRPGEHYLRVDLRGNITHYGLRPWRPLGAFEFNVGNGPQYVELEFLTPLDSAGNPTGGEYFPALRDPEAAAELFPRMEKPKIDVKNGEDGLSICVSGGRAGGCGGSTGYTSLKLVATPF